MVKSQYWLLGLVLLSPAAWSYDQRAIERNYVGSATFSPIGQDLDVNTLLEQQPSAAGLEPRPEGVEYYDARAIHRNYQGSTTSQPVRSGSGLQMLLKQQPTAAGAVPEQGADDEPAYLDSRQRHRNYYNTR